MKADNVFIHDTAIVDAGAQIGAGSKVWHFSHIMGSAVIGKNCIIGQNVCIDGIVGDGGKIQNNVSIYKGVALGDNVFCGPSAVFTNVTTPRAHVERKDEYKPTSVHQGATIGANATILCGITLGDYCMIGAGAVVTKDVAPHSLMIGTPAIHIGWVCACGNRLKASCDMAECSCGQTHIITKHSCRVVKE